jgi:hypothetical protein
METRAAIHGVTIGLIVTLALALSACATEPETIVETVVQETTVEVPQTVEVTKIVEVEITSTPEPTPEPTPTNTLVASEADQPAAPPAVEASPSSASDVTVLLLQASMALREHVTNFRDHGMATGNCNVVIENQDNFLAAPSFDVSGAPDEVQLAYGHYLAALELAKDAALGISQGCRDAIANQTKFTITGMNYNDIRGKLDRALEEVGLGIDFLEPLAEE